MDGNTRIITSKPKIERVNFFKPKNTPLINASVATRAFPVTLSAGMPWLPWALFVTYPENIVVDQWSEIG